MRFTNISGDSMVACDHCREDIAQGNLVFTVAPGKIEGGYIARDYNKGEMVLCPRCAKTLDQVLSLLSRRRSEELSLPLEAA